MRQSLRSLRKTPAFSILVVAVLALGIGANTALFSIIDRVLLHPFPYRDPDRLVAISGLTAAGKPSAISPAEFEFWQTRVPAVEQSAIWHWREIMVTGVEDPESLWALEVSPHTFDILGVPPIHGRLFHAGDFRSDSTPVVILNYRLWQHHFHGDPAVVGRQILLDRQGYTVIGIMPPEFVFHRLGFDLWVPLNPFHTVKEELKHSYNAMARLRPGATLHQAQQQFDALAPAMPRAPGDPAGWHALLRPYTDDYAGEYRRALYVLWGAVLFVLLIACANAANLLLARVSNRRREFALRASLGAGRLRLSGQLLLEGVLLGAFAGAAGIGLAVLLLAIVPQTIPFIPAGKLTLTPSALLVALGAVLATTVLCALPSCWHLWRSNWSAALHSSSRGASADRASNRTRAALLALEFALSVTLLISAGLMLQSLSRLLHVPLGFNPDHVLTARVSAPSDLKRTAQLTSYFDRVLEQAKSIPGARSAAVVTVLPLSNIVVTVTFNAEGEPPTPDQKFSVRLRSVSPEYFETLGIPMLRGRPFNDRDTAKSPAVAIVNDELARHYWPGQDPIGKRVSREKQPKADDWLTVVGVVPSAPDVLGTTPTGELYQPYTQDMTAARATSLVVRTADDPLALAETLRKRIHALNPDQPVTEIKTMQTWVREAAAQPRFNTLLLDIFAALAFLVAISGIFAVVSYAVTQRTREIGIRSALGATAKDIAIFVVHLGLRPVLAGTLIGIAGALAASRLLRSQLFETPALDPVVFAIVLPLLLASATAAALLPTRRATRIDPAVTLRSE